VKKAAAASEGCRAHRGSYLMVLAQ
jgi:hypothetical protein